MADAQPTDLYELMTPAIPRMLHSGDDWEGQPYVYLDENGVEMAAGTSDRGDKGITVTSEFGTQITGPMSFAEMPQAISFGGGYWRLNPMALTCIGSSAAMPIPMLVYDTPNLLKSQKDMQDIGAGIGV
jgi:hypothetical protein